MRQPSSARGQLCQCGLIAYQKPLYQVLALEEPTPNLPPPQRSAQVFSVQEILRHIFEKGGPA